MKRYPFYSALVKARELYALELEGFDFENIALIAWNKIGNKDTKLYKYVVVPEISETGEYYIDLPCNADIIESVTADYEDYQKTSPTSNISGSNMSSWSEGYVESRKFHTNHLYTSGKYIKYRREENRLYLSEKFNSVKILYKGVNVDDEGLPYLTEDESLAIATFCAYVDDFKKARITKDKATFEMALVTEQKWKTLCTQARVPEYINQNEMDEILNVSVSWDRKRFGKSFKPIR